MKTGLTIQQMAQELLRQSKAKQDYLVNTGSLSLSVTTDAPQLRVTENGLDKIAPLDIRQTAHRQLGTYADGFVAQIKDINAQRAQAGAAASSIIGDGDASHLELPDNGAHFALGAVIDGEREELPA